MEFKNIFIKSRKSRSHRAAFTLVELLVGSAVGGLMMAAIMAITFQTSRSVITLTDSASLNAQSRYAIDRMSQKLRQASSVTSFSTNSVTVMVDGNPLVYRYEPAKDRLVEVHQNRTNILLSACEFFEIDLFKRNPLGNSFDQFPASTDTNEVKLVRVSWLCRTTLFSKEAGASEMISAKIVLRAK